MARHNKITPSCGYQTRTTHNLCFAVLVQLLLQYTPFEFEIREKTQPQCQHRDHTDRQGPSLSNIRHISKQIWWEIYWGYGSQCKSITTGVIWSNCPRPRINRAAEFNTDWSSCKRQVQWNRNQFCHLHCRLWNRTGQYSGQATLTSKINGARDKAILDLIELVYLENVENKIMKNNFTRMSASIIFLFADNCICLLRVSLGGRLVKISEWMLLEKYCHMVYLEHLELHHHHQMTSIQKIQKKSTSESSADPGWSSECCGVATVGMGGSRLPPNSVKTPPGICANPLKKCVSCMGGGSYACILWLCTAHHEEKKNCSDPRHFSGWRRHCASINFIFWKFVHLNLYV